MAVIRAIAVCLVLDLVLGLGAAAHAQPGAVTSQILRDGNTAALAGDWQRVAQLVDPLLAYQLPDPDLAEAHRLAGLAAFFQQRPREAEAHFLAYLRIDLDGRLDPALYPPDVVAFFSDVASRHAAELRARRTTPHRIWLYTLLPPVAQLQNGERTKAYVIGGALGVLLATNLVTYAYLRAWCDHTDGPSGGGLTCGDGPGGRDGTRAAERLRPINIASGIAFWVVYGYGVYDGIRGYRRVSREQAVHPYVTITHEPGTGVSWGIVGRF
ncbi:MAG: hypothetical protein E6J90_17335 [Deltaproteobacteria bacterium]|nr:MAG: hypothetical protein E6J90_17335 [Deltaproteobacteria bacterium]TMQ22657.1 MAG: hypothetical protein E6J91_01050 [Deltaproteobacteria bacterium]